jgi:predicted Zn-dependent protease
VVVHVNLVGHFFVVVVLTVVFGAGTNILLLVLAVVVTHLNNYTLTSLKKAMAQQQLETDVLNQLSQ